MRGVHHSWQDWLCPTGMFKVYYRLRRGLTVRLLLTLQARPLPHPQRSSGTPSTNAYVEDPTGILWSNGSAGEHFSPPNPQDPCEPLWLPPLLTNEAVTNSLRPEVVKNASPPWKVILPYHPKVIKTGTGGFLRLTETFQVSLINCYVASRYDGGIHPT